MEIHMYARHTAILCILSFVISWADVNALRHRSNEAVYRKRREVIIDPDVKETLEQLKQDTKLLESALINHRNSLEQLEDNIAEMKAALNKQDNNTRALQEKTTSILDFQKEFEVVVSGFRSELADLKHELVEDRNAVEQKFMAPLETLNQTVQHLTHKAYEDLLHQIAELKAEQRRQASVAFEAFEHTQSMKEALQEMLQFKEQYISKADQREKRAISNKCSLNVRQKPEDGRIDVLMVMDPPNTESSACN
ncbi:uncharacterized protein LOC124789824 [Schistocerca piceifrons]|uniref:uncharacterized protein LOC124789824 n=1 Tax=Schistocerca piceifrons TaxID=274613 RepID=UPI001F5E6A51|nr:uncharacterized protein LOC124789824 [Schistocerca piceifrons]